eukprot:scaffold376_cov153-Pinguiococcus_pyrenoidosus.AAC.1
MWSPSSTAGAAFYAPTHPSGPSSLPKSATGKRHSAAVGQSRPPRISCQLPAMTETIRRPNECTKSFKALGHARKSTRADFSRVRQSAEQSGAKRLVSAPLT